MENSSQLQHRLVPSLCTQGVEESHQMVDLSFIMFIGRISKVLFPFSGIVVLKQEVILLRPRLEAASMLGSVVFTSGYCTQPFQSALISHSYLFTASQFPKTYLSFCIADFRGDRLGGSGSVAHKLVGQGVSTQPFV